MKLNNFFTKEYNRALYESYNHFMTKEPHKENLLKEKIEKIAFNSIKKNLTKTKMIDALYEAASKDHSLLYDLWKIEGSRGLPKGFGTKESEEEFKQWFFDTLNENRQSVVDDKMDHLFEASNRYLQMFDFIKEAIDNETDIRERTIRTKQYNDVTNKAAEIVNGMKSVRNKHNLIVYLLNFHKFEILGWFLRMLDLKHHQAIAPKLQKKYNKLKPMYNNAGRQDSESLLNHFKHFYALDYEPIQNYDPTGTQVDKVLTDLKALEKEWIEKVDEEKRFVKIQEYDEILKDYGEYVWMKLDRHYCEDEGEAMGHCGNEGGDENANVLSFRKKASKDGTLFEPRLTFILQDGKYLTEMKGRGNDKPADRYHPYIIDLLKMDMIKAIVGGGYLPENNFSLDDLSASGREEVLKVKPLLDPIQYYNDNQSKGIEKDKLGLVLEIIEANEFEGDLISKDGALYYDIEPAFNTGDFENVLSYIKSDNIDIDTPDMTADNLDTMLRTTHSNDPDIIMTFRKFLHDRIVKIVEDGGSDELEHYIDDLEGVLDFDAITNSLNDINEDNLEDDYKFVNYDDFFNELQTVTRFAYEREREGEIYKEVEEHFMDAISHFASSPDVSIMGMLLDEKYWYVRVNDLKYLMDETFEEIRDLMNHNSLDNAINNSYMDFDDSWKNADDLHDEFLANIRSFLISNDIDVPERSVDKNEQS